MKAGRYKEGGRPLRGGVDRNDALRANLRGYAGRPLRGSVDRNEVQLGDDHPLTCRLLRGGLGRCFGKLKNASSVATRYDKTVRSLLGFIDITAIRLRLCFFQRDLEDSEVALVKAMIARGGVFTSDQNILACFTRAPKPSITGRSAIRSQGQQRTMNRTRFSLSGPGSGHAPNLTVRGDDLLIKALEAVVAGVQAFNSAGPALCRRLSAIPRSSATFRLC